MPEANLFEDSLLQHNLIELILNITKNKYTAQSLSNVVLFQQELANDLKIDGADAMAMLGYLFERKYIKIKPNIGIVVNDENTEMQKVLNYIKVNA